MNDYERYKTTAVGLFYECIMVEPLSVRELDLAGD
jgi:hypothetical protein